MRVLALETSSDACSVALLNNGNIKEQYIEAAKQHASRLLPMVDDLLKESRLSLSDMDTIAVSQGPGSFTGLRIGIAIAQGLAFAVNLPIVPVSTLQAAALTALRITKQAGRYVVCMDARQQETYWGVYESDGELVKPIADMAVSAPSAVSLNKEQHAEDDLPWFGVGSGWLVYGAELMASCGVTFESIYAELRPHAQDVAQLAAQAFASGNRCKATEVAPLYIRNKVV